MQLVKESVLNTTSSGYRHVHGLERWIAQLQNTMHTEPINACWAGFRFQIVENVYRGMLCTIWLRMMNAPD